MIDWNRVSELRDEVGAEDFGEVVELFLEEVDSEIEILKSNSQKTGLETQLHFLKGSALNLGFSEFSQHCQIGESTAALGEAAKVDVDAILSCYDASRSEFVSTLERLLVR